MTLLDCCPRSKQNGSFLLLASWNPATMLGGAQGTWRHHMEENHEAVVNSPSWDPSQTAVGMVMGQCHLGHSSPAKSLNICSPSQYHMELKCHSSEPWIWARIMRKWNSCFLKLQILQWFVIQLEITKAPPLSFFPPSLHSFFLPSLLFLLLPYFLFFFSLLSFFLLLSCTSSLFSLSSYIQPT